MSPAMRLMYKRAYATVQNGTHLIAGRTFVVSISGKGRSIREKGTRREVDMATWTKVMNHLGGIATWTA